MQQFIMNLPTLKEIEVYIFQQLHEIFSDVMIRVLEEIDRWLMEHREHHGIVCAIPVK